MAKILDTTQELDFVRFAQNGDAEAFAALYDAYISQIYKFVYYKTLHQETAEDISAEVFIKAWRKLSQFKDGSFVAWLYTIARHAVIDYYRRHHEHQDIDDCWDLKDGTDFLGMIDQGLNLEKMKVALQSLRSEDREILIMRFWQELSFAEISQLLNKREGAVKMSCARALERLRAKMPLALFILLPKLINLWKIN
jgi:RNA polymerase sigma-70 factor (ECF subfamily)